ncbi:MAG: radical SAM protein [Candidatus Heimdallarchaeota archaeon]|nr:radical SAM protein [Candidatus Heimdallarchaeota archaeon]
MTINIPSTIQKYELEQLPFPVEDVAFVDLDQEPFLKELRLYVTERCNFNCSFPCGTPWCHERSELKDKVPIDGSLEDFTRLAELFHDGWGFTQVKIAGMEPTLWKDLVPLVSAFKDLGYKDISLTSNAYHLAGQLADLVAAGLDRLTISLHSLDPAKFRTISVNGRLERILRSLSLVKDFALPTKLNHVLIKGFTDDVTDFLQYSHSNGFEPKLYQLIWHPGISLVYHKYFISPVKVLTNQDLEFSRVEIRDFPLVQRTRYKYFTSEGLPITFGSFTKKKTSPYPLCQHCHHRFQCQEGFMGYGYSVTPKLELAPCYLRDELNFSLQPFLDHTPIQELPERIERIGGGDTTP